MKITNLKQVNFIIIVERKMRNVADMRYLTLSTRSEGVVDSVNYSGKTRTNVECLQ